MSTKLFVVLATLIAVPQMSHAEWGRVAERAVENITYQAPWVIRDVIIEKERAKADRERTKAQERTDLARINAEAGLCGMTTASNQNGAMVKVAAYPDGTPCVTGTPDERMQKEQMKVAVIEAKGRACNDALGDLDKSQWGCNWINGGPNVYKKK